MCNQKTTPETFIDACVCVCVCVCVWSSCTDNARHGGGTDVYSRVYGKPLDLSKTMVDLAAQDE